MWLTLEGETRGMLHTYCSVTIPLESPRKDIYRRARRRAIKTLGERYVRDKSRHITKGQYEYKESRNADVAATWAKAREKLKAAETSLIVVEAK